MCDVTEMLSVPACNFKSHGAVACLFLPRQAIPCSKPQCKIGKQAASVVVVLNVREVYWY